MANKMANEEEGEDERNLKSREEGEQQIEGEVGEQIDSDEIQGAARLQAPPIQKQDHLDNHDDERKQKSCAKVKITSQQGESRSPLFVPIGVACNQERAEDGTCLSWRLESLSWALIGEEIKQNFTCLIGGHKEDQLEVTDCCSTLVATLAGAIRQLEESIGGRDCLLVCWGPQALRQHLHPAARRAKLELPKMFDEYVDLSKLEPGALALAPPSSPSPSASPCSSAGSSSSSASLPPSSGSEAAIALAGAAAASMQMLDRPAPCLCCHQFYLPAGTYLEPAHLQQEQQQQVAENSQRQQVWSNEEMLKFLSCAESNCEPQTTERLVEIMSELLAGLLADGHQFKRIERIKRRVEVGLCKPGGPLEQRVVRARGLPWQATEQDIADFFAGLNIARGGVGLCLSRQGRRNGEALIQFESREQRNLALLRHKHFMGARYIEVYRASADDFLSVAAGYNNRAQAFLSRGAQVIVRMRGLPFTCSARQILDFFHDCQLLGGPTAEDSILFVKNLDDKPTGDAFVLFPSEQQAQRALQKHKQNIGTRYVELFRSTISEVQQVLSISSSPPPPQEATSLSSSPPLSCSSASSPPTSSSSPAATTTVAPLVDSSSSSLPRHQQATAKASPVTYAQAAGQQQQQHQQEAAKREPSPAGKLALPLPRPPVPAGAVSPPAEPEGQRSKSCEHPPPQSPLSSLSGGSSIAGSSSQRSSAASGSGADRRRNQQYHHPNYHHFQHQLQHHHQQQQQQLSSVYGGRQHHYAAHMHHPAAYWATPAPHSGHRQHQHHYQPHLAQATAYHHHHHHQYGAAHPQSYPNYQYYPAAGAPPPPQYCAMAPQEAIEHHQHQHMHAGAGGGKRDCVRLRGLPFEAQVEDVLYFLGERSKEILFQGVHMVYTAQGQPSGEAIIQMSSAGSAAQVAQEFHKKVMSVGKKQRYIEVLPCSIDDINLAAATPAGGLLMPRAPISLAPLAAAPVAAAAAPEVQADALPAAPGGQPEPVGGPGEHQASAASQPQQQPPPAKPSMAVPNLVPASPLAAAAAAAAAATAAAAYYPVLYYYPPPQPQAMGQQQQVHHLPAAAPYHC